MASNIIIENPTIKQLRGIKVQLKDIKDNLKENQTLVITLDTETTGKYYNSYQAEQDKAGIVDKIIEIGAIFSIKETQADGLENFIPIKDINDAEKDLGFRSFFNPFMDGIKGFHKSMPLGAYEVHHTSREFLEAKGTIPNSFEKLKKPSPSLQKEYTVDGEKTTYIKEIMSLINVNDDFIAHNAPFDLGMINEAVKDQNDKIRESDAEHKEYVPYYKNNVVDTLAIFRKTYPRHRLIARQGINSSSKVSHKLDYMMEITGQKERNVHGAYWDSKLLIDSYSEFYKEFLEDDILRDIMIKKTKYLSNFDISYPNGEPIKSIDSQLQLLFKETLYNSDFLNDNDIETHLKNQLENINSKKRNAITQNQISNSIIYFKILMHENRDIKTLKELEDKFGKIKTFGNEKLLEGMKKSKIFSSNDISKFQSSLTDASMSHYLTQAIFNFYKDKLEREVFNPFVRQKYEMISELQNNNTVSVSKEQSLHYFRTDGSIATKDHSSTAIIGSVSDFKTLLKESADEGIKHLNYLDFNSIVNYLNFEKALKEFNEDRDIPITVNYGYTTLLRIDDIDIEVNIIAKNEVAFKNIPILVAQTYNNDYKDPHFTLEQFSELNSNDYFITTGSYAGIIEKVIFNDNIPDKEKNQKIINLFSSILEHTDTLNIEVYESDTFLYDYKKNIIESLKTMYPNSDIGMVFTVPKIYNKGDRDYHKVRCSKYEENYDLHNLDLIENFSIKNENNPEFIIPENMKPCETIPKDPVIVPGLITDLEFIKERRKDIYKELKTLKNEEGNLFDLSDNSKENVSNIQLQYFRLKAREGLDTRFEENNTSLEVQAYYNKRFDFEMEIIEKMKFDGYTLLVDDFLKTLEGTIGGLTGPGRGSAAGSLVSYGFKITEVDPMLEYKSPEKHLLFERYLNPERVSLPDVDMDMHGMIRIDALIENIESEIGNIKMYDIDIANDKKTKTIESFLEIIKGKYENDEEVNGKSLLEDYQVALWGNEKVAKIVTRDTYQAKSAIASVCRYLGNDFARSTDFKFNPGDTPYTELAKKISGNAFEKVSASFKKVFDEKHDLYNKLLVDLYNTNPDVKKIIDLAWKLEGTISNYGIHAAGLVLLDRENNYMNRGYMNVGGVNVTLLDNKYVEDYINIKFDFLGLASLEEIDKAVQFIRQTRGIEEAEKVSKILGNEQLLYGDKETFEKIFDTQNTVKIFQFSSDGMQDLVKRVKPGNFEDLVAITALYRPGPMESGMTDGYVHNKHNPEDVFYVFEEMKEVAGFTYGKLVYQEQVMKTVQVLGGFSLGGADLVRRAMGKKKKEVLDDLKEQFIEGTLKTYEGRSISYETLEHSAKEAESLIYMDKNKKLSFMKIKDFNVVHNRKFTKENIGNFVADGDFTIEDIPKNEIVRVLADNLFEDIIKFAGYGFNKSHAYAYTNVSMRMANLKAHYPLEFFASIFVNNSDDIEKLSTLIVDSKKNNIPLLGANINSSKKSFDIIEDNIVYGLSIIKEVGDKDVKNIIKERDKNGEFSSFSDFLKRMKYSDYNIGNKTIENLILAGAFDDIIIEKDGLINVRLEKISHDDNLSEENIKIIEEFFEKYEEKDQGLFFGLEDYSEKSFKERAIEIFGLTDNIDLILPMIYKKILNSTDEDVHKFMKNRKSFIKKFDKPVEGFLKFRDYIDIPDADYLNENLHKKRALLIKIFNMIEINNITESTLGTLNEKELENSSLIYITEKEYEITGSTSSIGTLLENNFVLDKIGNQQSLNFLLETGAGLKEEGDWRLAGVLKNIITGENSDGEFYCNLEIGDINNITKKFYLSQSQIMRYRNNLEIGSVVLLDLRVRESDENKFYSTLDDIKFFKESHNWEMKEALGKDTLRVDEHIDFDKMREDDIIDIEPITLDELEVEWENSINGWRGLKQKENKKVAFFLKGFKSITSKKSGKEWDIIEVGDGISKKNLEMFYPKQDSEKLKEFRNMPIIIELQNKKENTKYGISPAYNSDIIFLDERYISKDDDFEAKNKAISNINPILDGVNHINVYSKGKTELGQLLSNFSESPVEVEHKGEKITFKTLEGYWFFQKMYIINGEEHFGFKDMSGLEAKKEGSALTENVIMDYNEEKMFRHYIIKAMVNKIANNSHLKDLLTSSNLPLAHYYVHNDDVVELPQFNWLIDAISEIRDDFKSIAPAGEVKKTPYENLANPKINIANINNKEKYDVYCGRAKKGQISPLGNPYTIDYNSHIDPEEQRDIVCDKYDRYIKKSMAEYNMKIEGAISNIVAFIEDKGEITLGCFCAPKRCHCESIREVVLDEISKQLKRIPKPEKTNQKENVISDIIAKYDKVREIDGYDLDLEEIPF